MTNCVEISNLARFFSLNDVDDYVKNFILKNFGSFLRQDEFNKLSVDDVCDILRYLSIFFEVPISKMISFSSDNIRGQTELELFLAGDKWLNFDKANRAQYTHRVMRFFLSIS